jgi:hemerythrin-like domain-containing protein
MLDKALDLEPNDSEIKSLASQIESALGTHLAIEERLFYKRLRDRADDSERRIDVFEGYTEHEVAKNLIGLLKSTRNRDEIFKAELQVLCENVKHHVKEEESTIFSLARRYIPKDELHRGRAHFARRLASERLQRELPRSLRHASGNKAFAPSGT